MDVVNAKFAHYPNSLPIIYCLQTQTWVQSSQFTAYYVVP